MKRRPYGLLMGVACVMAVVAVVSSQVLDLPLRDPEGFLGPSWSRLPLLCAGAFLVDVVPRGLWRARGRLKLFMGEARQIVHEHWTRERVALVVIGLTGFYMTYVSYRNIKSYLPFVRDVKYDAALARLDEMLLLGHDPAIVLHGLLGTGLSAEVLSLVYLFFLPFVPLSLTAWLVWSRNISNGYWFVTAQCLCWSLGTASYYAVPTLGPAFANVWLYSDLEGTGAAALQDALDSSRKEILLNPFADAMQSVAGFASLHVAITLCTALLVHYTFRNTAVRTAMWVFVGLTVVATLYFGWHYIADDLAGALIAVVGVYLGGRATGQRFVRYGTRVEPSTSSARVPDDDRELDSLDSAKV